jgi:hypothetical protein
MHDLASRVSDADCKCYIMGEPCNIPEKVQHLAVVFNMLSRQGLFEVISRSKYLHTFVVFGGSEEFVLKIPDDIGERFTRLRTLDLSNLGVTGLPKSIWKIETSSVSPTSRHQDQILTRVSMWPLPSPNTGPQKLLLSRRVAA